MISSQRIKINIPQKTDMSSDSFEESCTLLETAFDNVFSDHTGDISFEKTYRLVYELVRFRYEAELYKRLQEYITKQFKELKKKTLDEGTAQEGWEFLETLAKLWLDTNKHLKSIRDLTLYLDRTYCDRNRVPGIIEMGLISFNNCILMPLKDRLTKEFVKGVTDIRSGNKLVDNDPRTEALKTLVSMMETILCEEDNFFVEHVQNSLLEASGEYYSELIKSIDLQPIDGFNKVKQLMTFEKSLDRIFLNSDSETKIEKRIENVLIWENFDSMIAPLLATAMTNFNHDLLGELYNLTSDKRYRLKLKLVIMDTIVSYLSDIKLDDSEKKKKSLIGSTWTVNIIDSYNRYQELLKRFEFESESKGQKSNRINNGPAENRTNSNMTDNENSNMEIDEELEVEQSSGKQSAVSVLNQTFSNFFQQNKQQSVQFLCFYLDGCLKRTVEKTEISNVRKEILECVKLIKMLPDKDEFTIIYKNQLSKRLLQQRSSVDTERFVVRKISDELGSFFTYKLETMLRDISTSSDIARNFATSQKQKNDTAAPSTPAFQFAPEVLTMTSWPFQNIDELVVEDIILPRQLEGTKLEFETFYNKKYNERSLRWAHNLGSIEIGFQFDKTYHDLVMPVYAGIIFLLFEDHDILTTEMISDLTNIPEQELIRQLLSLIMSSKSRILKKSPPTKSISKTDKFTINTAFTAPTQRVKVQTIVGNIPGIRSDANPHSQQLDRERISATNAAVVRILKQQHAMTHAELLEGVTETLKQTFALAPSTFKKSIGYLISKEYVQRDPEDPNLYHYLA